VENYVISPFIRPDQLTKAIPSVSLISSPASSQRQRPFPYRGPVHSKTLGVLMFGPFDKHDCVKPRGDSGFVHAIRLHAEDALPHDCEAISLNCFKEGNAQ